MKQLELVIRDLLLGCPPIKIVEEEEFEGFGEIVDAQREHVYGQVEVSDEGKLTSLIVDLEAITEHNDISLDEYEELSIDDLKEMGAEFAADFGRGDLQLSSFEEWGGGIYLMEFVEMDTKYNIPLPDSGVTLEMTAQGFVASATLSQDYYQLKYPEVTIDEKQAKAIFSQGTKMYLGAERLEDELRLMYYPKKNSELITVSGEIIDAGTLLGEENLPCSSIEKVQVTESISSLLGVSNEMTATEEDGVTTYTSASDPHALITLDRSDETEVVVESNIPFSVENELPVDELRAKAEQFLELIVGDIHSKYELENQPEEEEVEEEVDDDLSAEEIEFLQSIAAEVEEEEEEIEYSLEPFITFIFHRKIDQITLEEFNTHIGVGIYTGAIKDANIPLLDPQLAESLVSQDEMMIGLDDADRLYKDSMKMELVRVPVEQEDFIVYELLYRAVELQEGMLIERIDAQNGNVFYVDQFEFIPDVEDEDK
ncbi:MAG: hypothetical protein RR603_01735 [Kurthia sp.]